MGPPVGSPVDCQWASSTGTFAMDRIWLVAPPEDHLPEPALGIGALDEQIDFQRLDVLQDRFADATVLRHVHRLGGDARAGEIAGGFLGGGTGHHAAFDRQDEDPFCLLKEGAGEGYRARGFGAGVPGDHHRVSQPLRRHRRGHQDRPAAVEKCRFQRAHAWRCCATRRLAQHGDVEQPGMLTDEVVTRRRFYPEGRPGWPVPAPPSSGTSWRLRKRSNSVRLR